MFTNLSQNPNCKNNTCQKLTTFAKRYNKFSTYCSAACRRKHENSTWQEFVDNAPMCNTPECNSKVQAKRHSGTRTYAKTCTSTCLWDTRKKNAPECKFISCDSKVKFHDGRQKYDVFCTDACKDSHFLDIKIKKQAAAPKCKNSLCNNLTVPKNKGMYSEYCTLNCLKNETESIEQLFKENAPQCKYDNCDNSVSGEYRKYTTYCSPKCHSSHVHSNHLLKLGTAPKCAEENCNNLTEYAYGYYKKYCSKQCYYGGNSWLIKRIDTTNKNCGYDHWMQNPEYFKKYSKKRFNLKEYTFPSGKISLVQGYEPKALDKLLEIYTENEIEVQMDGNVPSIVYVDKAGKNRIYYPDIFIPKENLIIEVKSTWTYNGKQEYLELNKLKQQATLTQNYKFEFMIM